MMNRNVLEIDALRVTFLGQHGTVRAVDGVSLVIPEGKILALIGESSAGKSTVGLSVARLLPASARIEAGRIILCGRDLSTLNENQLRHIRGRDVAISLQEPATALNPVFNVSDLLTDAIRAHEDVSRDWARRVALDRLSEVGFANPAKCARALPVELSGGERQRVMVAIAISCNPKLLIIDEPTAGLDVTVQRQLLQLIAKLRRERGLSVLFISHDLHAVAEIADEIAVMYRGRILEVGRTTDILESASHPYTKALIACRPTLASDRSRLPTVEDFVNISSCGDVVAIGRSSTGVPLSNSSSGERHRLLHPKAELAAMGYATESLAPRNSFTAEDGVPPLLSVEHLEVQLFSHKRIFRGGVDKHVAVNDVSFKIYRGQTVGLVGESGAGKTTLAKALLRLIDPTAGRVLYGNTILGDLAPNDMRRLRCRIQIVFQDPLGSMSPRMTVEEILLEPLLVHHLADTRTQRLDRISTILGEVGLDESFLGRMRHELSGGQRQRICIARALVTDPDFIICDEAVSALDVSVQAQVLNLLKELQERHRLTCLFISHDIAVVRYMADMIGVMNMGRLVEFGPTDEVCAHPQSDYARRLVAAMPPLMCSQASFPTCGLPAAAR